MRTQLRPRLGATTSWDTEYRQELKPVFTMILLLIGTAGVLLALTGEWLFGDAWHQAMQLALYCWALAGAGLLLMRWNDGASRWFTVGASTLLVFLAAQALQDPVILTWLALTNLLAVIFLSTRAGIAFAALQTGLLAVSGQLPANHVAVGLIWATLAAAGLLVYALRSVFEWSMDHFRHADEVLREVRGRQQEVNQLVADLSRANQQLAQMNRLAQSLRQAADEALVAKERFVSNVSHELRTPLNMIIGFSETMLESPTLYGARVPPALLADLSVIRRNAEHLSSLVDDVLDLNQSELGEMTLSREHTRYAEIVDTALTAVRPLFASKELYLLAEVEDNLPLVYCDPLRIREVLMNLLSNAGRFTEKGGVSVRVWREEGQLYTAVADTGLGIADDKMQNLFQPFYQVDSSLRRRFGGTGLGLSISKRFIELHAGKIWVESKEGKGTTFFFRIPCAPLADAPASALQKIVPAWEFHERIGAGVRPAAPLRPRYVVLDATRTLQRLVKLADEGADMYNAANLEMALSELQRTPAQALLANTADVPATLAELEANPQLPAGTPVLLCTLAAGEAPAESPGVHRRLVKPVARPALLDAVQALGVKGGTVLIVDDEPDALQLFARMLTSTGEPYRILQARDGREALAILQSVQPDLILLDLVMPNLDGFQLLQIKGADAALRDIPVIVLSAQDATRQPIIAGALAFTRGGGFSAGHMLSGIQFTARLLGFGSPAAVPEPAAVPRG